jgi:hypothetical protein
VDVKEIGSEDVNWINLAKDSYIRYSALYKWMGYGHCEATYTWVGRFLTGLFWLMMGTSSRLLWTQW